MCIRKKINRESEKPVFHIMTTFCNPLRGGETKSDGVFPFCGKPTNFFRDPRFFDGFFAVCIRPEVENPVENVDNRAVFPPEAEVILGELCNLKSTPCGCRG